MARRFKQARKLHQLKMTEAAQKLGISQPTLSAWETERKSPSIEGLEHMADLYGYTTDYLLGRAEEDIPSPTQPIPPASLPAFHGKPVWSPEHGWMLVNAAERMLLCLDGSKISISNSKGLYALPQLFAEPALPSGEPLARFEVEQQNRVWVEPISSDSALCDELRGWYQVKERYVQNEYGNRFYLDAYGAKWLAFCAENIK